MKKHPLDFWVGLFVVLGFAALLFLALNWFALRDRI